MSSSRRGGLTRSLLAFLLDAYDVDEAPNAKGGVDTRTVMRFDARTRNGQGGGSAALPQLDLSPKARDLAASLRRRWNVEFDDAGAIGRRYRRQDEIGTPFCVTVDFETLGDDAVTVRERDHAPGPDRHRQSRERLVDRLPPC